jgi:hypothetical protein
MQNPYSNLPIEDQRSLLAVLSAHGDEVPDSIISALKDSLEAIQKDAEKLAAMAMAKTGKHYYVSRYPEGLRNLYVYAGGDFEGDIMFQWEKVGGQEVASMTVFDDTWKMLAALPDLIELMARLGANDRSSATIEEFIAELEAIGFSEYRPL